MYSNSRHDELEPRPVPKPTRFQEISVKPEVPELSVVFESSESSKPSSKNTINPSCYTSSHTTQETYSEWKERQNRSPIHKEPRYYDSREKHYCGSSMYSDSDQNPYGRFSDKVSYKSVNDYHKCACQNAPTVKDIYNMMQIQNDQIKFLLETIQTLLVTVLSNQQTHHKCCCSNNNNCKNNDSFNATELSKTNDIPRKHQFQNSNDVQKEKPQDTLQKIDKFTNTKNVSNKSSKGVNKTNKIPITKKKTKTSEGSQCNSNVNEKSNKKDTERTYSIGSDESFDLNENDVQVTETPISPEPSIHIEMKSSSSEDSSNSDSEKEKNDKQIEVGWTMYKNIIGQVNNLLENTNSEQKSEMAKPVECVKPTSTTNIKKYEPYTHFVLPENGKIDSSLQMQALAMQYLSPEQAVKFDIVDKHFVPKTQGPVKSPNNYSISTMHYMERYHLIGPEKNCNSENPQLKLSTDEILKKKKKSSRKSKSPSKILNITELKQQPKLP